MNAGADASFKKTAGICREDIFAQPDAHRRSFHETGNGEVRRNAGRVRSGGSGFLERSDCERHPYPALSQLPQARPSPMPRFPSRTCPRENRPRRRPIRPANTVLRRRWTRRDRQQRRRAVLTRCSPGAEELSVCRIGCWRGAGGDDLQLDCFGETQRSRSRSLSAPGADAYRRPSHQPHRGVAALEHHLHSSRSVHLTASWTLSNTVHCERLPIA